MADFTIRKVTVIVEETHHDGGPAPERPRMRAAATSLVANPFAGRYVEDLQPAMEDLKPLGLMLTGRLLAALGGDPAPIHGYGKGAIVGSAGEVEHGALWHVPLGHVNAAHVRSHFDAMEVGIPDGPRPDEILSCLAMAIGGRVHDRMGGLRAADISVWDSQR